MTLIIMGFIEIHNNNNNNNKKKQLDMEELLLS